MWKAVFEGSHESCIIAPLCKKYDVTDFVYLVNAWTDKDSFYYSEAHILQSEEGSKKKFAKELKKQESILKFEKKSNFILTLEKRPLWMAAYMPLWDKRIIQTKPVVQRTDGTELWEMACWDKEPLMQILERLPKEFKIKLRSITKDKLDAIFFPHVMPNLSEKQEKVIRLASDKGYFNLPRKINLDGLAKRLNLSKQTVRQHLMAAEKKLVPFLTENLVER